MSLAQTKNLLAELKFLGMLHALEPTLKEAQAESWSISEALDRLLQTEYQWREQKTTERRIKGAKLKLQASFEDFDFTAKRTITKTQVKDLYQLDWLAQGRSVILVGQTGVGKTFLAQAMALHACRSKHTALFLSVSTFLEQLATSRTSGTYLSLRAKLARPDLLVLDDWGLRKLTSLEAHDLCDLLEERSFGKSTLITTQLPLDHWPEVVEDPVIADAIIDRLKHSAVTLTIKGESYRKVKATRIDDKSKSS